jgi:UPF0716 protein FxsA
VSGDPDRRLGRSAPASTRAVPRDAELHLARTVDRARRYVSGVLLKILFVLLGVQLVDLLLLILLSRQFGFWQTVAVLFAVGLLGSGLARREGGRVWRGFQGSLAARRPPEHGVIDGMLVLLGGVLLLLPGILSDVIGLALFIPPLRRAIAGLLRQRFALELELRPPPGMGGAHRFGGEPPKRPGPSSEPAVIDTTGVESPD